jgi:nucleoid DNA-binding protein
MAVIEALLQDIPELLLEGKIIKLGDFGSFRLTINGTGANTQEEYSTSYIEKTNLHFRAGKVFQDVLASATFKKFS